MTKAQKETAKRAELQLQQMREAGMLVEGLDAPEKPRKPVYDKKKKKGDRSKAEEEAKAAAEKKAKEEEERLAAEKKAKEEEEAQKQREADAAIAKTKEDEGLMESWEDALDEDGNIKESWDDESDEEKPGT